MKQTQNNMASGHPLALLLKMSVPIMISMTVQSLYNIVDSIFVARLGCTRCKTSFLPSA